jgi:hypothetical protein
VRLVSAVLGFILRKVGLFAALLLSLFLGYLLLDKLVPSVQQSVADRERLEQVVEKQEALDAKLDDLEKRKEALVERRDDICGFWGRARDALVSGTPCRDAQEKVDEVASEQVEVAQRLDRVKDDKENLQQARGSGVGWVINQWAEGPWRWLLGITALLLVLPLVLRFVSYFVLMPLVTRAHSPIHLAAGSDQAGADLHAGEAQRTLRIRLPFGEVLSARSEHIRPVRGQPRSKLLYDWTSPFISFAAGLHFLTRIRGDEDGTAATLAAPDDPDAYLMRIDFTDHPGVVMRPRHIVGVIGQPGLSTRWRWGLQALATWQVRYILFSGTGSLIVQGIGDVVADTPGDGPMRMDQNLLMGFDSRLTYGVDRTDVFMPYLRGRRPLVDDEFTGQHPLFWQKSGADGPRNPIAKAFDAIFSAFGKMLGF